MSGENEGTKRMMQLEKKNSWGGPKVLREWKTWNGGKAGESDGPACRASARPWELVAWWRLTSQCRGIR